MRTSEKFYIFGIIIFILLSIIAYGVFEGIILSNFYFISLSVVLIIGAIFALFFPTIGVSLAIGMFFPPHMAICLMLGGAIALILEKRKGKEWMNDKGKMAATALEIGATFTVPILILLKLFF